MTPLDDRLVARRALALTIIRAAALVLLVLGAVRAAFGIGLAILVGDFTELQTLFDDNFNWLSSGVSFLVAGGALALMSRRIARWLVPAAKPECPECGYAFRGLNSPRCPECGWQAQSAGPAAPAPTPPAKDQAAPHDARRPVKP